jgi:hypothetical protein
MTEKELATLAFDLSIITLTAFCIVLILKGPYSLKDYEREIRMWWSERKKESS